MPSLHPGFEYDIFISYRQNDNRSGWVRQFVEDLRQELGATLKDPVNIYFDENPHDGLQDTHLVDESLKEKLNCLIFIPILSRTYCDQKSFAWNHEFVPFCQMARGDGLGPVVRLANGNAASRVLPVIIHDIDPRDKKLFEEKTGTVLRGVEFVFRSPGINRPLTTEDERGSNQSKTIYKDQVNKVANALGDVLVGITNPGEQVLTPQIPQEAREEKRSVISPKSILAEIHRRNVLRAAIMYVAVSLLVYLMVKNYATSAGKLLPLLGFFMAIGLVLAITLAWLFERSPQGWTRIGSPESSVNPYKPDQRKPLTSRWVLAPLLVLILYFYYSERVPQTNIKTIAVLPFENRSPNPGDQYFSEGFSEDIVIRLYEIGDFTVISSASSRLYKDTKKTIKEIADELGAQSILTGSVFRNGSNLKVTVTLHDGSNNEVVWSEIYERMSNDIFTLQSEIVRRIAGVLKVKLTDFIDAKLNNSPTRNLTAHDHLLKGKNLYNYSNSDSMDLAIKNFQTAITLDADYPEAYAALADAYVQLHARFARGIQWTDSAIVAARRSVLLDSNLSDGYKALGAAHNYARRYDSALLYFQKAISKNKDNAQAIGNLGGVYFVKLDYSAALRNYRRSTSLNPNNPVPLQTIGWIYRLMGDYPRAEHYLRMSLKQKPLWDCYRELAFVYLAEDKSEAALELIDSILELGSRGTRPLEIAGRIAHFAGDKVRAKLYFGLAINANPKYQTDANSLSSIAMGQLLLDEGQTLKGEYFLSQALDLYLGEIERGSPDDDPPFNVAAIYAIEGKREQSLQYLNKAVTMRWIDYVQVEKGPYFHRYRNDPEFVKLVDQVKRKVQIISQQAENAMAYASQR